MDIVASLSAIRGPNEDMSSKISCKEITVCSTSDDCWPTACGESATTFLPKI
ncbi:hypothetical protein T12_4195 [Trichinella patagoniensis]|uniref:Uncharacterized protein n=1 Tax=Trichinella patagoniensis TaxID=990121 RepID=A0A0V0Z1Y2_9BILA|nr:hypothetical protein T12_4195 [Trichinella patagoniensis]